jgi:DNA polymerase III delta' subunit
MNNSLDILSLPKLQANLAHAYIVEGVDSEKRLSNILGLTRSLLCQTEQTQVGEYCGHCHSCKLLDADTHPDFMMINADQGTIGVDDVRAISQFLSNMSHLSGNQVIVLEHAENMTENASNALLKTLEEPTDKCFIFLLCKSKAVLLPTILSRCQFVHIANKSKEQLKAIYPDLADYIIGFSNNSESELAHWVEDKKVEEFTQVYQLFIQWLKNQIPNFVLANEVGTKPLMSSFLLYLIEKRIKQLMLKAAKADSSQSSNKPFNAVNLLTQYKRNSNLIKGQNKALAMSDFLSSVEPLLR